MLPFPGVHLFSLTLFLSAALAFVVQPLVAKRLLPLLGGSPAVWNTCLLFFQATLLSAMPSRTVWCASGPVLRSWRTSPC